MEPSSSAQDVYRCDLCETAIVPSYCDICHVNLCKPCIGEHISDGYEKHKIVPFQDRRSTYIYPMCKVHAPRNCEYHCKDCHIFVCSSCMASEQHKRHLFEEVSEVCNSMKETIENDEEKLENFSRAHKETELDLEKQLASLGGIYDKLTTEITRQGVKWHKEIDIVISKMKTEASEIKSKHRDILQTQLDEKKQQQNLIKEALLDLREIKKSKEVSQITEYSSQVSEFSKIPSKVEVTLPKFKPEPIDCDELLRHFGQITPLSTTSTNSKENAVSTPNPNQSDRVYKVVSRRKKNQISNRTWGHLMKIKIAQLSDY